MGRKLFCSSTRVRLLLSSSLSVLATSFSPDTRTAPLARSVPVHFGSTPLCQSACSSKRFMATRTDQTNNNNVEKELLAQQEYQDVLPFEKGSHNSAKVVVPSWNTSDDGFSKDSSFRTRLETTIQACRALNKSSLWVHVPMSRASLMEDMVDAGFAFHHAAGQEAVLNLWLRDSESKIPEYATHQVGVGAVVINSRNEILCVRELRRNYMPWKVPTGLTELGESLDEAAVREVREETGIATTFHSLLCFRQTHGLAHGRSDLFFVCRLDPVEEEPLDEASSRTSSSSNGEDSSVIPMPVAQECEIERTAWVPYSEYRAMVMDREHGHPMMQQVLRVLEAKHQISKTIVESVLPGREPNDVYFPAMELEERDLC